MFGLLSIFLALLTAPFKSKSWLEAENAALRRQLIVLRRKMRGRVRLTNNHRWFLIQLYRWFPSILNVLTIIRPETLVRWHRAGFRCYWRWKSGSRGGRPQIETDPASLCWLLQRHQNASVIEQRCPGLSPSSADRKHQIVPNPWRASSPLCAGLGFRYTHGAGSYSIASCILRAVV